MALRSAVYYCRLGSLRREQQGKSLKNIGNCHRTSQCITGGMNESTVIALDSRSNPELDQMI